MACKHKFETGNDDAKLGDRLIQRSPYTPPPLRACFCYLYCLVYTIALNCLCQAFDQFDQ